MVTLCEMFCSDDLRQAMMNFEERKAFENTASSEEDEEEEEEEGQFR